MKTQFFSNSRINAGRVLLMLAVLFIYGNLQAQYYWVGNSGDWTDYENHWATTSGGSTFHSEAPTQDDNVYFDANSFTSNGQVVNVDGNYLKCRDMDFTGVQFEPTFQGNGYDIFQCFGSLTLSSDMIFSPAVIQMASTESGNTIQTNGTEMTGTGLLRIQANGTFELLDNLVCGTLQIPQGTFHTNGNDIYCSQVQLSGTQPKNVYLYDSEIHISQFRCGGSNINLDTGTSNIFCSIIRLDEEGSGPYSFNKVTINNDSGVFYNSGTIETIDLSQTQGGYLRFESGETVTFGEVIGGMASRVSPLDFYSSEAGEAAYISTTMASLFVDYIKLKDMHTVGSATFNADNCLDNGNNVGWNITDIVPLDFYWVNNGGNWSDLTHWATTSGGSTYHTTVPSQFDNVIVDAGSFTLGGTITVDGNFDTGTIQTAGTLFNPTIYSAYGNNLNVYGSLYLTSEVNRDMYGLTIVGTGNHEIQPGISSTGTQISFWGGGFYTFIEDVNCSSISLLDGTIDFNDHNITCGGRLYENNYNDNHYILGNGVFTVGDVIINDEEAIIDAENSTIHCYGDFQGGGHTFNNVIMYDETEITDNNTFNNLEIIPGSFVNIESETTQTINNNLSVSGTSLEPITIISSQDGLQATFDVSSGMVNGTFLLLKDNNATGGATFNAAQSVDNGNNSGWNITEIVPSDFYWVGGSGDWSDAQNHWATTSGGNVFFNYVPGGLDNVYFDENSFDGPDQVVTLDLESINIHDMDWTGVTNNPTFDGYDQTMNVYGSLIYAENMFASITNYNFLSDENEIIHPGFENSPGFSSYLYFNASGEWDVTSNITAREIQLESGSIYMNEHDVHVDFGTYFYGEGMKVLDFTNSNYYSRSLSWNTWESANLLFEGAGSTFSISSSFSPNNFEEDETVQINMNDILIMSGNSTDECNLNSSFSCNTMTIIPGKTVNIYSNSVITVNQLIAQGEAGEEIIIQGTTDGTQGVIYQASGTVNGEYLQLQDTAAQGDAEFYANNSENLGNVSGWIFTGVAQTINFDPIDDVMEDVGTFNLNATATSGLEVVYSIIAGDAVIDGNQITIQGAGPVIIEANQSGNTEYNPAPSTTVEFCSIPLQPIITSTSNGDEMTLTSSADDGNQWYLNGNLIPGGIDSELVITQNGVYTVQVDAEGCISEISLDFEVTELSISDLTSSPLSVYPNPANEFITISHPMMNKADNIKIFSIDGRIVSESSDLTQNIGQYDVSHLTKGNYIIYVISGEAQFVARFIKE